MCNRLNELQLTDFFSPKFLPINYSLIEARLSPALPIDSSAKRKNYFSIWSHYVQLADDDIIQTVTSSGDQQSVKLIVTLARRQNSSPLWIV